MFNRRESEIGQEPPEPYLCFVEVQVMAEATLEPCFAHPRLLWVDLPRVEIENERSPFLPVNLSEPPSGKKVWEEAEIAAPGNGDTLSGDGECCNRNLHHF
jgi:hypothetical protein